MAIDLEELEKLEAQATQGEFMSVATHAGTVQVIKIIARQNHDEKPICMYSFPAPNSVERAEIEFHLAIRNAAKELIRMAKDRGAAIKLVNHNHEIAQTLEAKLAKANDKLEMARSVITDPKYSHDIDWVKANLKFNLDPVT